jgi:hypothetical protein
MSLKPKQRKCRCCNEFFFPDYRNAKRQYYCGKPACRQARKQASQRRWRLTPFGRKYFRSAENIGRVRQWRRDHPGYWKRKTPASEAAQVAAPQQVSSAPSPGNPVQSSCNVPPATPGTLQDFCLPQHPGFVGLISLITGRTLQDDIVPIARRVVEQGQNILGLNCPGATQPKPCPDYDRQTSAAAGSAAANSPGL